MCHDSWMRWELERQARLDEEFVGERERRRQQETAPAEPEPTEPELPEEDQREEEVPTPA